jgi:hypothetical protein
VPIGAASGKYLCKGRIVKSSPASPDQVACIFRRLALDWLRADLKYYGPLVKQDNPAIKQQERQVRTHWRGNADLASVRNQPALDLLSENERAAWQTL